MFHLPAVAYAYPKLPKTAHRGPADGGTVIGNQSKERRGDCMGDKSPKARDRQKKQDAKEKGAKVTAAALKVAAKQAPSNTRK
jgi:hypothetical protein